MELRFPFGAGSLVVLDQRLHQDHVQDLVGQGDIVQGGQGDGDRNVRTGEIGVQVDQETGLGGQVASQKAAASSVVGGVG